MSYTNKQSVLEDLRHYQDLQLDDIDYVEQIDDRLNLYMHRVLNNPDDHNMYEILAVYRFLDFLDKYAFDAGRFQKFVRLYEMLKFPSDDGPKSFELTPLQIFQFASIYGFVKDDGTRLCKEAVLHVPRKFSKALSLDTPLPTPEGWKPMGHIQEGDYVYGPEGKAFRVTAVSEVFDKPMYSVLFTDGSQIKASEDHIWTVRTCDTEWQDITTSELYETRYQQRYMVPSVEPVPYPERELPIDPYKLGCWLAGKRLPSVSGQIRKLGWQYLDYIPEEYLISSIDQRVALLQGIMDARGRTTSYTKECVVTLKKQKLAFDFQELVSSLGILARFYTTYSRWNATDPVKEFSIAFKPRQEIYPFRETSHSFSYAVEPECKYIADIIPIPNEPSKCISIDSASHLYLAGKTYTPTHNTTSVAACAIYDMLLGDANAQAYVASNTFRQAKICFSIIDQTVKMIDPKMASFRRNREMIYSILPGKTSFIQCLSSSPDKLDGLNASVIILDEYAAAKSAALKNVLTSSQAARREPLTIIITTASTVQDGPYAAIDFPNYQKILKNEIEDDTIFPSIFQPDEDDDIGDKHTWDKVQPHMGITVKPVFYRDTWKKAQRSAEDLVEFKTKLLNIFSVAATKMWLDPKIIEKCIGHIDIRSIKGRPITFVATDLSIKDDMSAVCYLMYDSINHIFWAKIDCYLPRNTIANHPNCELYQRWVDEGFLHICGEEIIDYEAIAKDIIENGRYLNIVNIAYDAYRSRDFINYMKARGINVCTPYKQTNAAFTAPVEELETMLYEGRIIIDDNPIFSWFLRNCVLDTDNLKNCKPTKVSFNRKIDGAICLLMNIGVAMNYKR